MAISTGIAVAGIGIAMFFWLRRPSAAAALERQFSGVHRLLLNKYYLDEIYNAVIVQPIKQLSTGALWKGVDAGLIDGSVNGVGAERAEFQHVAAARADGVDPDLRGLALPWRGAGSGMVLVELRSARQLASGLLSRRRDFVRPVFRLRLQTCSR